MTLEQFKALVEDFIAKQGITATAFGKRYAGDPLFVFQIRAGREPREATRDKVIGAMAAAASQPEQAA